MNQQLKPCPFCGKPLTVTARRHNPHARCRTENCKGAQLPLLNLDQPEDIERWNRRLERDQLRADVLKDRIDQLRAEVEMMREDAERWRYVSLQGDDTHWLNLLRVDLEDFGGNINAAVDALIDGEAPAITAKEA